MNSIDLGIIGIILVSSGLGIWRGLTKEALGLISWIGAGISAYLLLPVARHFAQAYIHNVMVADAVAALGIFITFLVFFSLISHIISTYVKDSALGGIDRALGFGFGITRGAVILAGLELALSSFMPRSQYPVILQQARFMPMLQSGSESLLAILPKQGQDFIMEKQLKFMHDRAQKDLDSHIEAALENKVKEGVAGAMDNVLGSLPAGTTQPAQSPTTPTPSQHSHTQSIPGLTGQVGAPSAVPTPTQPQTPGQAEPAPHTQTMSKKDLKPATKMDAQKTMENLANLKVQVKPKEEKQGYGAEQLNDLDRLIETVKDNKA